MIYYCDVLQATRSFPRGAVDLLFLDPPYGLHRDGAPPRRPHGLCGEYHAWVIQWLRRLLPALKPTASVYICGDWRTSHVLLAAGSHLGLRPRNRIVWEREKGRSAARNWKSASEDIWFFTVSDDYTFNADAVRSRRDVRAPYRNGDGTPKDWDEATKTRLTGASNCWTDLVAPFWSMPENTPHPFQKPEKLVARVMLASSNPGDLVLDPFMGSGTTAVVALKLGRRWLGSEIDTRWRDPTTQRLLAAKDDPRIQGYEDGAFLPRGARQRSAK